MQEIGPDWYRRARRRKRNRRNLVDDKRLHRRPSPAIGDGVRRRLQPLGHVPRVALGLLGLLLLGVLLLNGLLCRLLFALLLLSLRSVSLGCLGLLCLLLLLFQFLSLWRDLL